MSNSREFASAVNTANTESNPFRKHYIIPLLIVISIVILAVIPIEFEPFYEIIKP